MATNRMDNLSSETKEIVDQKNIEFVNNFIKNSKLDTNKVSDGYHTFGELYEHRIQLWMALVKAYHYGSQHWVTSDKSYDKAYAWKTKRHSDGELAFGGGWFVLGLGLAKGTQMTYHLPESYWDQCDFAVTIDKAPDFDGHTSEDVLQRIKEL